MPAGDPLYAAYHDEEWGTPSHDDRHLYEMIVLEGAQAGLSWSTILRKREGYRSAFAGFDAEAVARFGPGDVERLMADPGIVRNRLKVESAIANAHAVLAVREEHGSLDAFLWGLVPERRCGAAPETSRPRPRSPETCRRRSSEPASGSSDRPSATPSCRPSESPTTTLRSASATPDEAPRSVAILDFGCRR